VGQGVVALAESSRHDIHRAGGAHGGAVLRDLPVTAGWRDMWHEYERKTRSALGIVNIAGAHLESTSTCRGLKAVARWRHPSLVVLRRLRVLLSRPCSLGMGGRG
jgi:hypothetical protein